MKTNLLNSTLTRRAAIRLKFMMGLGLLCTLVLLFSFVPKANVSLEKLLNDLKSWAENNPQEKVYLHMDKPYYALGDTIWFKGYVTVGSRNQLSALSGAVYVDLINDKDSVISELKLPVTSGMVMGDFVLIDDYKQGNYRIRAYTQWMRNAGPEYFFDRTFTVGDLLSHNLLAKADYQYKTIGNEEVLTALLHFTDDEGHSLGDRSLRYQIVVDNKVVWAQNTKTDALGSVNIKIADADKANLSGAYIRTIVDGSNGGKITRDFPIRAEKKQHDVQFFPEGGNLVDGMASRIGFKVVGIDGLGVNVKGKVVDQEGNVVNTFATAHAGMGTVRLRPQAGKTYSAQVSFADGTTQTVELPIAADDGYVLSVFQPNRDSVLVRIKASSGMINQNVNLIAQTRGERIFSSYVRIERPITSVWIPKKNFPSGIAQFTLFDNGGDPINERIAFIKTNDLMKLNMATTKASYIGKERVTVNLEAKDGDGVPTAGNFSVAVIDESKMPIEEQKESTIFSNMLLTSDIKGYVEQPNYYFTKETEDVNYALDNLMLTQGYRRFTWKELQSTATAKPKYEVEGLGTKVTGRVTTLTNQIVPNADVTLVSVIAGLTKFTKTDANGRFTFDGIFLTDSLKFTVQARGPKNSNKVKVLLDQVPTQDVTPNRNIGDVSTNIAGTMKEYIENGKKLDDVYEKYGMLDKVHRLREVRIKARKPAPPPYSNQFVRIPEGLSDQTIMMDPKDTVKTVLSDWLMGKLKFTMFMQRGMIPNYPHVRNPFGGGFSAVRVMLDGRLVDDDEALNILDGYQIQPESIYKIEVVRTNRAVISALGTGGPTLMIFTKRGYIRRNYTPSIANFKPKGFNRVREFYSPKYERPDQDDKLPDLRTTVYWNPYLKTDVNGRSTFSFYNADGPASYKVIVEGINADGQLGRQVYRYVVDGALVGKNSPNRLRGTMITSVADQLKKRTNPAKSAAN